MAKKKDEITWTEKRKEVADLAAQGKGFMEIVSLGYSKDMTSKVLNALKKDNEPVEPPRGGSGAGDKPMVTVVGPKIAPIVFRVDQKQIVLDPLELNTQYRYYAELVRRDGGITEAFSQVLTLAMQVLWVLHQDIPLTENMLKAIFYGSK